MRIFTTTAMSLDGKGYALGSDEDRKRMRHIRNQADAILVGGNTFRNYPHPSLPENTAIKTKIWNIVLSRTMDFSLSDEFVNSTAIRPLFLTTNETPKDFPLPVIASSQEITPEWIVGELKERGIENLLIEGGGDLIYQFLEAGLIDDIYVTLCPKIIGDESCPDYIKGEGFRDEQKLELINCEQVENEIYLHYRVIPAKAGIQ
mgnify:FL=1